jgi:glycosyltransferase involved in cell wall biosynthesis
MLSRVQNREMQQEHKNIKILFVITRSLHGGAQSHLSSLIRGLAKKYNVELFLATDAYGFLTDSLSDLKVGIFTIPSLGNKISVAKDITSFKKLLSIINEVNPDIIHAHSSKAGLLTRLAAKIANKPTVFTAHGWGFKPNVPILRRYAVRISETFCSLLTDKIICVSEYDRKLAELYKVAKSSQLCTILNGVPDTTFMARPENSPVKAIVVARFAEPKQHEKLVAYFSKISSDSAKLILVGDGPNLHNVIKLVKDYGLEDRVVFTGDRDDVEQLLADAQIFVLLSDYEGLPISIIEAMRAGLPVIASNVGGVPEEVADGVSGFLVENNQSSVLAKLNLAIESPLLRSQMGAAGRKIYLDKLHVDSMVDKTVRVYAEILTEVNGLSKQN